MARLKADTYKVASMEITFLSAVEAARVEGLLADKSLDYLAHWETGEYQALDSEGDLIGYVQCSGRVAQVVNGMLRANRRQAYLASI